MWGEFEIAIALIATILAIVNVVSVVIVSQRLRRNYLRRAFRQIVSKNLGESDPAAAERSLADAVADANAGNSWAISPSIFDRYIVDYIVDVDFKRRYYTYLLQNLNNSNGTKSEYRILEQIHQWSALPSEYALKIERAISSEAVSSKNARAVQKFIARRSGYYEEKKRLFIDDVADATQHALREHDRLIGA